MKHHDFTPHEMQDILFAIERACLMGNPDQDNERRLAVRTHVTERIMECAEDAAHDLELTLGLAVMAFGDKIWNQSNQRTLISE